MKRETKKGCFLYLILWGMLYVMILFPFFSGELGEFYLHRCVLGFIIILTYTYFDKVGHQCPSCKRRSRKIISWHVFSKDYSTYIKHKTISGKADRRFKNNSPITTAHYVYRLIAECKNNKCDEKEFTIKVPKRGYGKPLFCNKKNESSYKNFIKP